MTTDPNSNGAEEAAPRPERRRPSEDDRLAPFKSIGPNPGLRVFNRIAAAAFAILIVFGVYLAFVNS